MKLAKKIKIVKKMRNCEEKKVGSQSKCGKQENILNQSKSKIFKKNMKIANLNLPNTNSSPILEQSLEYSKNSAYNYVYKNPLFYVIFFP